MTARRTPIERREALGKNARLTTDGVCTMNHRNTLLDKLASSSLRLNTGLAVLFGLALLLIGLCYWGVNRMIQKQEDTVKFHFTRLMENIREQEAFLTTVSRKSAEGELLDAYSVPVMVQRSSSDETGVVYEELEYSFSLPFSVKINPARISAQQHAKVSTLGANLANFYSAFWSASHYQSPQVLLFNLPDNFDISVPSKGRLRGAGQVQEGDFTRVVQQVTKSLRDHKQTPLDDQVHWVNYDAGAGVNAPASVLGYINIDLSATQLYISGASPSVVITSLLTLDQVNNIERIMQWSIYDHFSLIAPTGEALVGSFKPARVLHEGLNLNSGGLVFRVTSPGAQPWAGIYVISFKSFLDYAFWPLFGLIALMLAGLGGGWAFNRWYQQHVVLPAHQALEEIAESEAFSRAVIDTAPAGLCVVRCSDYTVLLENQHALDSHGTAKLIAALHQQHDLAELGYTDLKVEGRHWHVSFVFTRYQGQDAWLCAFHDVTRLIEDAAILQEARRAADSANEAKTRFLATMSHEIRTPLYGVLGTLELMGLTALDQRQQHYLQTVQRSSATLFQLISDVLDVSKIESGQMTIDALSFCPLEMSEVTLGTYSAFAQAKGLQLYACIDAGLPDRVRGDPLRIRQILNNLLSNAIKFTDSGRVVLRVRVLEQNSEYTHLQWQVSDSGLGISQAQQVHLFDPFYQVRDASSEGGAGLGLSICRRLCELMGGQLDVVSEPGLGSSFNLQLKLPREPGALADCPRLEPATVPVYVRAPAPELTQHLCAWLNRLGAEARPLPGDMRSVNDATLLVDMLATRQPWAGPRINAIPGGCNPPEHGADGWEVDAYDVRAIARAVSYAQHGHDGQGSTLLSNTRQPLDLRILVAEDNPINQAIIKEQLEALGCSVTVAFNGEQALALWLPGAFDLVLTDVNMPILNGYELTRALRQHDTDLPVIGITANAMREEGERCAAVGMNAWMVKPLNLLTLRAQLLQHCKVPVPVPITETDTPAAAPLHGVDALQLSPRMRKLFISAMHDDLHKVRTALDSGDAGALAQILHSMGGALGSVQALALAALCAELEHQLAGSRITPQVARDVLQVQTRLEAVLKTQEALDN